MTILTFLIVSYILLSISLFLLFPKAGVDAWKGLVPGLNFIEWCTIVGRPKWWALLLLIPIVNLFIFVGMAVDMVRSFGKLDLKHSAAAVIYCPAFFFYLALNDKSKYLGQTLKLEKDYNKQLREAHEKEDEYKYKKLIEKNPYRKSAGREWIESIVFAVFAAAFIRMFLIEAYVIPTASMEGTLVVGDFLFVSKAHYGIRTPMTVLQVPLLHNRIPFIGSESYLKKPDLPYKRLKPVSPVLRNKPFVFNWPAGDSVYITKQRSYSVEQIRLEKNKNFSDRELVRKMKAKDYVIRPIDKKDHYIKRCVGIPGDTFEIVNRQIFINKKAQQNPSQMQFDYSILNRNEANINTKKFEEWGITDSDVELDPSRRTTFFAMNNEQVEKVRSLDQGLDVRVKGHAVDPVRLFPHDPENFSDWSIDNYGPIYIPEAGASADINMQNISLYRRIIETYENNDFEIKDNKIFINGEEANSYTFKQNYYWAVGDNRHRSEDSRYWGYVPEDHIVGKPLFVWFSTKNGSIFNGINWSRLFTSANKD